MTKQQNKVLYQIMREIIQLQKFIDKKLGGKPKKEVLDLITKRFEHIEKQIEDYEHWLGDLAEVLVRK